MWKKKNKENGPRQVNYLWVLAGGYLIYLGVELIYGVIKGESTLGFWGILAAAAFFVVGGAVCLREWKIYRYGTKEEQLAAQEREAEQLAETEEPDTAAVEEEES